MLTLKNILTYEALSGKSFRKLDGQDADDVLMLMYCCVGTEERYTYKVWSEVTKKYQQKDINKFAREISRDIDYCNQFRSCDASQDRGEGDSKADKEKDKGKSNKNGKKDEEDITYTEVIGRIITDGGMEAQWVLEQSVEMLPILSQMVQEHEERKIENERFWAFVLTAPYRDKHSKVKTPKDWLPMPFDKKKKGKVTEDELEMARKFFAAQKAPPCPPRREGV